MAIEDVTTLLRNPEAAQTVIIQTLEAYNLANPMNLIALIVLKREIEGRAPDYCDAPLETKPIPRRPA